MDKEIIGRLDFDVLGEKFIIKAKYFNEFHRIILNLYYKDESTVAIRCDYSDCYQLSKIINEMKTSAAHYVAFTLKKFETSVEAALCMYGFTILNSENNG